MIEENVIIFFIKYFLRSILNLNKIQILLIIKLFENSDLILMINFNAKLAKIFLTLLKIFLKVRKGVKLIKSYM
jgi:hypothetical protein